LSAITNFFASPGEASYAAANLQARTDYAQVQPCTGSSQYYVAPGYSLSGAASGGSASPLPTSPPPVASPGTSPAPTSNADAAAWTGHRAGAGRWGAAAHGRHLLRSSRRTEGGREGSGRPQFRFLRACKARGCEHFCCTDGMTEREECTACKKTGQNED
jgi:hypothetical protein